MREKLVLLRDGVAFYRVLFGFKEVFLKNLNVMKKVVMVGIGEMEVIMVMFMVWVVYDLRIFVWYLGLSCMLSCY